MNPWELSASDLLVWGIVLHLIADWPLQNAWLGDNKAKRGKPGGFTDPLALGKQPWWHRHPAAYVHAGIHAALLALVFGWAGIFLGIFHLVIDTRWPVERWSQLVRQTQPGSGSMVALKLVDEDQALVFDHADEGRGVRVTGPQTILGRERESTFHLSSSDLLIAENKLSVYDIGTEVRFWTDQVFHIACIAIAALVVAA